MYRQVGGRWEFFLVHPGGPFFRNKDDGHWTIPKGEPGHDEPMLEVAQREFIEETGIKPQPPFIDVGSIQQKGGKWVYAWGFEGDHDGPICSNTFATEWPPGSGKRMDFPEVDRAGFFGPVEARRKIKETQWPLIERLIKHLL
jgi:predicted NUDIX family NTP pyrophosphohydrolase